VMPDAALGARDLMAIMRDTFEGTDFDLSRQQPAAGPFGWPDRYDSFAYPQRGNAATGAQETFRRF